QPIDNTLRGKYLFEVIDDETGDISWSRSFSSIYGEWETTGEARRMNRTLHESIRFPAPTSESTIVMKKRDAKNEFQEVWRTTIDPDDYMNHRENAMYADQVVAIVNNGDPAEKVDLLLLGDGYTATEHDDFIAKARELTQALFEVSPFKERKQDFNVWALAPASAESGVSRPSTNIHRDSPLGTTYDSFRSERYVLTFDNKAWRRVASSTPYDFVEILTNTETYGGGGIYGLFSTAAANSASAVYLFVHEFGHHFAGLADEYYTSSVAYEASENIIEPYEPNVTALLDPDNLKWKHLVGESTPLPTPWPKEEYEEHSIAVQKTRAEMRANNVPEAEMNELFAYTKEHSDKLFAGNEYKGAIGAFEGANYQAKGYYRSEQNCLMFTRTDYFCRVCSDAIEKVIDEYTRP
ncbi:MAG: M64 family metallopeptidase, partial [Woeseiaceae bacterium]